MNPWLFLLFTLIFAALVAAHFVPAWRAWRRWRGEQPSDIDPGYVRMEDYFARSFRVKVCDWLLLPVQAATPDGVRVIDKGRERIRESGPADYPPRSQSDEIIVVNGTFRCGAGCIFNREILIHGDGVVGAGSRIQSVAADGDLVLGSSVRVARWADSAAELEVGTDSSVGARVTAGRSILLMRGSQVTSAYAPRVMTPPRRSEDSSDGPEAAVSEAAIPVSADEADVDNRLKLWKLDPRKLSRLGSECWVYRGDLLPSVPIHVTTRLVVKGHCTLPGGSVLDGDLKVNGRLTLGAHSVAQGNLVATADVSIGPESRFYGVVHAGGKLRLGRAVSGGSPDKQVAAFAADTFTLEEGIVVFGKVASGDRVTVAAG